MTAMREEHNRMNITNQFSKTLPLADSVVFVPCVPCPLGVCEGYKNQ